MQLHALPRGSTNQDCLQLFYYEPSRAATSAQTLPSLPPSRPSPQKKRRGKQFELPKWHVCERAKRCTVYECFVPCIAIQLCNVQQQNAQTNKVHTFSSKFLILNGKKKPKFAHAQQAQQIQGVRARGIQKYMLMF